jgi:hypothetical protein
MKEGSRSFFTARPVGQPGERSGPSISYGIVQEEGGLIGEIPLNLRIARGKCSKNC